MPLTLITGPANAAKAGAVLDRFRVALERAGSARLPVPEPRLVVPTSADVEPYQRELADAGLVFGVAVSTFADLLREIAAATSYRGRALGKLARERVVAAAVADTQLRVLAPSAATPGFAAAAGRLFTELQDARVDPPRLAAGLRRWAAEDGSRPAAYADEVAALFAAYRARLDALGRVDAEGRAWGALDALRADPAAWGARPVFLYGFDELTPAQLDAVETLVRACGAPVTLSLAFESGRAAFAARAGTVETLRPLADELVELPERADHYAPAARPALHHLERHLFDAGEDRQPPNGTIRLLEAGGERAEAELLGAALIELVERGIAPADLAVLLGSAESATLIAQVLTDYGLPVERVERVRLDRTRLGAGLLAFGRAGLAGGTARDVLAWLRTPGRLADPAAADALEGRVRRNRARSAREALRLWEGRRAATDVTDAGGAVFDPVARLAAVDAAAEDPALLLAVLEQELEVVWAAPHRRRGQVLDAESHADARVAAEVRRAADELRELLGQDPTLVSDAETVLTTLAAVEVRLGGADPSRPGIVLADPLDVRARRFRGVAVCGLQDGSFPRRPQAEPFLDDDERRALARASGIVLPLHENSLERERYRLYAAVSRAREVLLLSYRSTDEEGEPQLRSPFVDDVLDLFTDELWDDRGRRLLAEVTWPPAQAPTPLELRRARAVAQGHEPHGDGRGDTDAEADDAVVIHSPAVAARQAARATTAAGDLETYAACGIRWLVERVLRPGRTEPDPEPLHRGSLAHDVLERTLSLLRARTGSARLTPERHGVAADALRSAIAEQQEQAIGVEDRARLIALEADLGRWLALECEHGPGFEPRELEWSFGGPDDDHGPLDLGTVRVTGRVDRIDVGPGGQAIVRDYKNSRGYPVAKWAEEGRMQAALYAVAARELLGLDPAGAVYQPLKGRDMRARGVARSGAAAAGLVGNDVVDPTTFETILADMTAEARDAAGRLLAGELRPCPERCTSRGCAYPAICRAPGSEPAPEEP